MTAAIVVGFVSFVGCLLVLILGMIEARRVRLEDQEKGRLENQEDALKREANELAKRDRQYRRQELEHRQPDPSLSNREQLLGLLSYLHQEVGERLSTEFMVTDLLRCIAQKHPELGGIRHLASNLDELQVQGLLRYRVVKKGDPPVRAVRMTKLGNRNARSGTLPTDPSKPRRAGPRSITIKDSPGVTLAGGDATGGYFAGDVSGHSKVIGNDNMVGNWSNEVMQHLLDQIQTIEIEVASIPDNQKREELHKHILSVREAAVRKDAKSLGERFRMLRRIGEGVVSEALWTGIAASISTLA